MEVWTDESAEWNKLIHAHSHTRPSVRLDRAYTALLVACTNLVIVSEAHESWLISTSSQNFCSAVATSPNSSFFFPLDLTSALWLIVSGEGDLPEHLSWQACTFLGFFFVLVLFFVFSHLLRKRSNDQSACKKAKQKKKPSFFSPPSTRVQHDRENQEWTGQRSPAGRSNTPVSETAACVKVFPFSKTCLNIMNDCALLILEKHNRNHTPAHKPWQLKHRGRLKKKKKGFNGRTHTHTLIHSVLTNYMNHVQHFVKVV